MPIMSWLDPEVDFMTIEEMLGDVEMFVSDKNKDLEKQFDKWIIENKTSKETDPDWYSAMEDGFSDKMYIVDLMGKNLFNGLSLTLNTIFEQHVNLVIRHMGERISGFKILNRHTYSMKELRKIMRTYGHPNVSSIPKELWWKMTIYMKVRNCLIHKGGAYASDENLVSFVNSNKSLFKIDNGVSHLAVKTDYINGQIQDYRHFFKQLLYKSLNEVIL